jgi:uncharacterized protein
MQADPGSGNQDTGSAAVSSQEIDASLGRKAIKASQAEVSGGPLEPWGRKAGATGEAETSGRSLLPDDAVPGFGLAGIWECTPGSWTVAPRPLTEIAYIVSGRGRVTDAGGEARDLGPGDFLVLPAGWTGEWEIFEVLRKAYSLVPDSGVVA